MPKIAQFHHTKHSQMMGKSFGKASIPKPMNAFWKQLQLPKA